MTPGAEETLDRVRQEAEAGAAAVTVYLGIAPGVGKTYTALEELIRHKQRGTHVVIVRSPLVALVDELAHTHAPGSRHAERWQDVEDLVAVGFTVISTVNSQHLESLADIVENITGVHIRERVPHRVIDDAHEVELIDMSPHATRPAVGDERECGLVAGHLDRDLGCSACLALAFTDQLDDFTQDLLLGRGQGGQRRGSQRRRGRW